MQDLLLEKIEGFLKRYYWDDIVELSTEYPEKCSLAVTFADIDIFEPQLADMLLQDPDVFIDTATQALRGIDIPTGVSLDNANLRIIKNPQRLKIRDIRHENIGKFVSIEGLVTKATEVNPRMVEAVFECPFCGHIFSVEQSSTRLFKEPVECERESGGCGRKVNRFKLLVEKSKFIDSQKIRVQESLEELRGGALPQSIDVSLESDLTGAITPGDRVVINGILRSYQKVTPNSKTPMFEVYMDANSLEKLEEEYEEITITEDDEKEILKLKDQPDVYEKLIRSIAPSIFGYEEIKEALVLQLFGGIQKTLPDGMRIRGDIHILLVGDPGLSKSQIIAYQARVAPRGLYTSGKGSSAAGLTATVVKDEFGGGRWTLEGGALVLADKGLAAVDELDKMKKEDRESLHDALEQQIIPIAKAGIIAKLNSRCALLAAANPKYGRFDKYTAIGEQINMPPALLSRFDLIFTMMDRPNEEMDENTAKHVVDLHYAGELNSSDNKFEPVIPLDLFKKYIAYSKRNTKPRMSEDAKQKFIDFYIGLRRQGYEDEDAPVPVTVRQLESLIRLGEAKARTRLSNEITVEDADRVISVVSNCLKRVFVDPETGKLDVDWVAVGTTKTKRDRARSVREIIKDLEKEYGEVPIEEVLDLAEEQGMEREKAEEIIEVMKRDGILFSPSGGVVKFVR